MPGAEGNNEALTETPTVAVPPALTEPPPELLNQSASAELVENVAEHADPVGHEER